jgi:hypothetical protein
VRVLALAECGTHAIIDAAFGAYATGARSLAPALARSLGAGMLLLADRGLHSFDLWRTMAQTGTDLVWRTRTNAVLPVVQPLPDGSSRSQLVAARDHRHGRDPITVRVVEHRLDDPGRLQRQAPYRLQTTILDPGAAPAVELAALYAQRWELETALDELKTHQRGPHLVLRSKTPEGVEQEVWGMLLVHYAIRQLMHQAAVDGAVDPDRVSFVRSLRVVRRQVTQQAGFSPSAPGTGSHGHDC